MVAYGVSPSRERRHKLNAVKTQVGCSSSEDDLPFASRGLTDEARDAGPQRHRAPLHQIHEDVRLQFVQLCDQRLPLPLILCIVSPQRQRVYDCREADTALVFGTR
jgi:hypothetical protein